MYWDTKFPRLVTCDQAKELADAGRLPLVGVCDITCDLHGSVEFLTVRNRCEGFVFLVGDFVVAAAAAAVVISSGSVCSAYYGVISALSIACDRIV